MKKKTDFRCITSAEELGLALISIRLSHNLTATDVAKKSGLTKSTVLRYEKGAFSFEHINTEFLERFFAACGENRFAGYTDYHLFKKFHIRILDDYITEHGINKSELGPAVGVSKQLALTWLRMESRCPSFELWKREFEGFSREWIQKNPLPQ